MKITGIETLHGDGGYRVCSYVKVTTDDGIGSLGSMTVMHATPRRA